MFKMWEEEEEAEGRKQTCVGLMERMIKVSMRTIRRLNQAYNELMEEVRMNKG
jgi:hypothetical protein